jgi:hypothetical protein
VDCIQPWVTNPDVVLMRHCRWLGFAQINVDTKRKKEPKKEK